MCVHVCGIPPCDPTSTVEPATLTYVYSWCTFNFVPDSQRRYRISYLGRYNAKWHSTHTEEPGAAGTRRTQTLGERGHCNDLRDGFRL